MLQSHFVFRGSNKYRSAKSGRCGARGSYLTCYLLGRCGARGSYLTCYLLGHQVPNLSCSRPNLTRHGGSFLSRDYLSTVSTLHICKAYTCDVTILCLIMHIHVPVHNYGSSYSIFTTHAYGCIHWCTCRNL